MAFEAPLYKIPGLKAAADLSAKQFKVMKMVGSLSVNVAGDGEAGMGILQNLPSASGQAAEVVALGVSKVLAGDTITAGQRLASDANGDLVPATSGERVMGVALEGGSSGELISAMIMAGDDAIA